MKRGLLILSVVTCISFVTACTGSDDSGDESEIELSQIINETKLSPAPSVDDLDLDGITDDQDNCPSLFNPDQGDTDQDGIGNFCDS